MFQVALFPGTSHTVPGEADRGGGVGEDVESTPLMPNDSVYDALVSLSQVNFIYTKLGFQKTKEDAFSLYVGNSLRASAKGQYPKWSPK